MPIKGLSTQEPQLKCAGILRKGGKKEKRTNARGETYEVFGKDLAHFRFEGCGSPTDKRMIEEAFHKTYGDEPQSVKVWLVHPTPSQNFEAWMELYGDRWLKQRCDRSEIVQWYNGKTYSFRSKPCHYDEDCGQCALGCKEVGRLVVWIPELFRAGFVDPILVETHSKNDIAYLAKTLDYWDTMTTDIRGIPFHLERVETEINRPSFDRQGNRLEGRGKMKSWLLNLRPSAAWVQRQLVLSYEQQMMLPQEPAFALPGAATVKLMEPVPSPAPIPETLEATFVEAEPESLIEQRLKAIAQLTGCAWSTVRSLGRVRFGKSIQALSDREALKLRNLILMQWAEMQYHLTSQEVQTQFLAFWGQGQNGTDQQVWAAWQGHLRQWAIECQVDATRATPESVLV